MRRAWILLLCVFFLAPALLAGDKVDERLGNSASVLREILNVPDDIPLDLLNKAECVVVIPSVKKLALGFGGSYGRGAMVCRGGQNFTGPWGPPSMMALEGGSFGLQLGGQATDFVLLVMNPKGAKSLLSSKVKLGADVSAAAGPKGRAATAATDAWMRAEILSYSRNRGLFAGVSLEGSTLRPDNGANEELYHRKLPARQIVMERDVSVPAAGQGLVSLLNAASPRNQSG